MSPNSYVKMSAMPPVTLTGFDGGAKTFTVNMSEHDSLILNLNYTFGAGTAIVFTFHGPDINDITGAYGLDSVNYSTGAITAASFSRATGGASLKRRIAFSIPALNELKDKLGNITVTVAVTGANGSDAVTITPYRARVAA